MKELKWDDEAYATGFKEIDQQHKKLFEFINQLGRDIESNKSHIEIEKHLEYMSEYIKNHFGSEEVCMAANHCPFATKNVEEHNKFLESYEQFKKLFEEGTDNMGLAKEMHTMLTKWTVSHICRIDSHLRECYTHMEFESKA